MIQTGVRSRSDVNMIDECPCHETRAIQSDECLVLHGERTTESLVEACKHRVHIRVTASGRGFESQAEVGRLLFV